MGLTHNMGKLRNGDAVHLISVSGSQEGNALHSNMAEGAGLSFGSTDRSDLGWVLDMDRTSKRKKIRSSDVIHLRPCGWGDGCSDDYYFHSNATEGGMMSGGGRDADYAWYIEGEKGGCFSFGADAYEYGWRLERIDDFSTSKCGDGKKVKNCSYIHLRSCSGSQEGNVLHSNMEEGAMMSYGGDDHGELGWRIIAADDEASKIRYGMEIMLQGMGTGTFMHSNATEGGAYSGGGEAPEYGFVIEGGDEGDKVRYGQVVMLRCIADPHDGSDRGAYMHSNGEEGGGFSFGEGAPTYGWTISSNSGWSSDSSD